MSKKRNNPTSNRPALKLSDAPLVLLSAAAQRDDRRSETESAAT
jgi:hypothetical protein